MCIICSDSGDRTVELVHLTREEHATIAFHIVGTSGGGLEMGSLPIYTCYRSKNHVSMTWSNFSNRWK